MGADLDRYWADMQAAREERLARDAEAHEERVAAIVGGASPEQVGAIR